ncbi:MAG: hypothetical protein K2X54_09505 [Methylobacterium organophilum]|nr:hypothetical protein [Methylobacterium organophilum]
MIQFSLTIASLPQLFVLTVLLMLALFPTVRIETSGPRLPGVVPLVVHVLHLGFCAVVRAMIVAFVASLAALGLSISIGIATFCLTHQPAVGPGPGQQLDRPATYEITPGDESDLKVRADLLRQGIYEEQVPSYDERMVGKVISRAIEAAKQRSL